MNKFKSIAMAICSAVVLTGLTHVHAQSTQSSTKIKAPKKRWNLSSSLTIGSDFQKTSKYDKAASSELGLAVRWKLLHGFRLSKSISMAKEFTNDREQSLGNGSLSLSRGIYKINNNTSLSGKLSAILPYNKVSREQKYLYTSIGAALILNSNLAAIKLRGTSPYIVIKHSENFNKFTQDINGKFNTRRVTTQTVGVSQAINDQFSLDVNFTNIMSKDYKGKSNANSYASAQSLTMVLPYSASLTIGHQIGGSTFDQYTQSNLDIKVFDSEASQFFMSLGHTY